jgi:hypothetical protein
MTRMQSPRHAAIQRLCHQRKGCVVGGLHTILKNLDRETDEGLSESSPQIVVAATEWDRGDNTIRLYEYQGCVRKSPERLLALQQLGHDIYDCTGVYTEVWAFSENEDPYQIWNVRDDIIERSLSLLIASSDKMWMEQEIHAVGAHARSTLEWMGNQTPQQRRPSMSGRLREGTVRLSLKYDRAMRQTVKLYAASKDTNESAVVNAFINVYVDRVFDIRVSAPRQMQDTPAVGNSCHGSYIIGAETRRKMEYLKQAHGVSFSEITRAAIAYCMAMEDSDNLLRSVSAELARNQSDERVERASEPLAPNVVKRLDQAIRAIAFRDPALSTSCA